MLLPCYMLSLLTTLMYYTEPDSVDWAVLCPTPMAVIKTSLHAFMRPLSTNKSMFSEPHVSIECDITFALYVSNRVPL